MKPPERDPWDLIFAALALLMFSIAVGLLVAIPILVFNHSTTGYWTVAVIASSVFAWLMFGLWEMGKR